MVAAGKTYEVLRTLARGGMGEVLLAREQAGDIYERFVVLKTVLPHLAQDEAFVRAFLDEARIACQLQHPNIAQIFDVASLEGAPCIVMEWLRGRNVGRILRSLSTVGRPMPTGTVASIVLGAASALGHAHRATDIHGTPLEVVHRDVSPQNIVLTYAGVVKLIDFGIALSLHRSTKTATGILKGKIAYVAPEQLRGRGADARSDLWALGVVAWECLTGRRLFASRSDPDVATKVLEAEIAPPSLARPEVDPELDAIVLDLLARDPAARIQTASELEERLAAWSRSHPLPTQPQLAAWLAELLPEGEQDEPTGPGAAPGPIPGPTSTVRLVPIEGGQGTERMDASDTDRTDVDAPASEAPTALLTREQETQEHRTRVAPTRVVPRPGARPAWLWPAVAAALLAVAAAGALGTWLVRRGDGGPGAAPPASPDGQRAPAAAVPPPAVADAGQERAPAPSPTAAEPAASEPAAAAARRTEERSRPRTGAPARRGPRMRAAPRMQQTADGEGGLVQGIDSVYDLDRQ